MIIHTISLRLMRPDNSVLQATSEHNAEGQLRELLFASTPSKPQKPKQTNQKES